MVCSRPCAPQHSLPQHTCAWQLQAGTVGRIDGRMCYGAMTRMTGCCQLMMPSARVLSVVTPLLICLVSTTMTRVLPGGGGGPEAARLHRPELARPERHVELMALLPRLAFVALLHRLAFIALLATISNGKRQESRPRAQRRRWTSTRASEACLARSSEIRGASLRRWRRRWTEERLRFTP